MLMSHTMRGALASGVHRPHRPAHVVRATDKKVSEAISAVEQELNALMKEVGTVDKAHIGPAPAVSSEDFSVENTQYCDENGCVMLFDVTEDTGRLGELLKKNPGLGRADPLDRVLSGKGWRIGLKTFDEDVEYSAMVGGETWNVSLSRAELSDFILALQMFKSAVDGQAPTLKWNTDTVLMEATVKNAAAKEFDLTFQVGAGGMRNVMASWEAATVNDLMKTLEAELQGFAA